MSERRPRRLHWGVSETPTPKHPYRDTLILYGVFAVIIVLVAWATGGGVGHAVVVAAVFYLVASGWSLRRWRERLREDARREGGA